MSQNTRESLSALMDGESDELELRRLLKALPDDDDAAQSWRRYHLARSMMQRERSVDTGIDLSANIMARLEDEPLPTMADGSASAARRGKTGGVSFMRGAGVAAAVSLMVISGVQFLGNDQGANVGSGSDIALAPTSSGGAGVQPVSLAASQGVASAGASAQTAAEMPMFEPTPFRLSGQSGLMNVSDMASFAPGPMAAAQSGSAQSVGMDPEQIRQLQSYLEQHAQGAAYGSSDSWMPLMRSSAVSEPLGLR